MQNATDAAIEKNATAILEIACIAKDLVEVYALCVCHYVYTVATGYSHFARGLDSPKNFAGHTITSALAKHADPPLRYVSSGSTKTDHYQGAKLCFKCHQHRSWTWHFILHLYITLRRHWSMNFQVSSFCLLAQKRCHRRPS